MVVHACMGWLGGDECIREAACLFPLPEHKLRGGLVKGADLARHWRETCREGQALLWSCFRFGPQTGVVVLCAACPVGQRGSGVTRQHEGCLAECHWVKQRARLFLLWPSVLPCCSLVIKLPA
jgi:hypothetical protein